MSSADIKKQNLLKIKEAARRLYITNGIENTTMNEIAAAAEISKVSLYKHFNSKGDVAVAIARDNIAALTSLYRGKYCTDNFDALSGLDQLIALLQSFAEVNDYDVISYYFIMDFNTFMHRHLEYTDTVIELAEAFNDVTRPFFIHAIQKGRADGTIKPGPNPGELFFLMASSLRGVYQHYFVCDPMFTKEHICILQAKLYTLIDMFLTVLKA